MSAGIQVFDGSAKTMIDTSTWHPNYLGFLTIDYSSPTVTVTDPRITLGTLFYVRVGATGAYLFAGVAVSISGSSATFTPVVPQGTGTTGTIRLLYGVY